MKPLIIYAHPSTKGHCSIILDIVKSKFNDYELIDLYKIKYDPVLHENEHYTSGNIEITDQNLGFQEKIKEFNDIIFIFPIWWYSMPAILKGFFDRVLTPGFAYKFINKKPVGLLKGKKAVLFITTGGPRFYYRLMFNGPIRLIQKGVFSYCNIKTKVCHIGNCNKLTNNKINEIKKVVNKIITKQQ